MKVNVKFSGRSIPVEIAGDWTIKDLKYLLRPLTNVLSRGQKITYKGRFLSDEVTVASAEISDGSKVMLVASQGLHQGDGPIKKEAVVMPSVECWQMQLMERKKKAAILSKRAKLNGGRRLGLLHWLIVVSRIMLDISLCKLTLFCWDMQDNT